MNFSPVSRRICSLGFWRTRELVKEFMLMMQRCTVLEKARTFFSPLNTPG